MSNKLELDCFDKIRRNLMISNSEKIELYRLVRNALSVQKAELKKRMLAKLARINAHGMTMDKQDINDVFEEKQK